MSIAATPEYAREYGWRRYHGLPTKGLAEEMSSPTFEPQSIGDPPRRGGRSYSVREQSRQAAERMIAYGFPTSQVMDALNLSYEQVQAVKERMAA